MKKTGPHIILLFILSATFFHSILFNPELIIYSDYSDIIAQHISWKSLISKNDGFSFWDPYNFSGSPAFANPQSMYIYPLHFLFYLLPIESAFGYTFLLHVFLSGIFMYLWARCLNMSRETTLAIALLYMLNTTFILKIFAGWISMYPAIMMIPLFFVLLEKLISKNQNIFVVYLAIAFGLVFYTSNYQLLLYTICFLFLYILLRVWCFTGLFLEKHQEDEVYRESGKRAKRYFNLNAKLLGAILVGILLASCQLLPVYEFKGFSSRTQTSFEIFKLASLKFDSLLTLFSPEIFGSLINHTYSGVELWEICSFVGIASLYFGGIAFFLKNKSGPKLFSILAFMTILLAMNQTIQKVCFNYLPFYKYFLQPSRILPLSIFFAITIAGYGLEYMFYQKRETKLKIYVILIYLLSVLLVCLNIPGASTFISDKIHPAAFLPAAFFLVLYNTIFLIQSKKKTGSGILKYSVLIIIISELFFFGMKYIKSRKIDGVFQNTRTIKYLKNDTSVFRVLAKGRTTLPYGQAGYYQIQLVNGYNPLNLLHYIEFTDIIAGKPYPMPRKWVDFPTINKPSLLNFLNVKYIMLNRPIKRTTSLKLVLFEEANIFKFYTGMKKVPIYLYENMNVLPRAYVVRSVKVEKDSLQAKETVRNLNPVETSIIEKPIPAQFSQLAFSENKQKKYNSYMQDVEILSYNHDKVEMSVSLEEKGFIVISDPYYPGWELYDNGKPTEIYRTNHAFRGFFLEKGDHRLSMEFSPKLYYMGAKISLLTGIILILLIYYYRI